MSIPEQCESEDQEPVLYENWRAKVYLIDKNFIEEIARAAEERGEDASDIRATSPAVVARSLEIQESIERLWQLEAMWAGPGSEAERYYQELKSGECLADGEEADDEESHE